VRTGRSYYWFIGVALFFCGNGASAAIFNIPDGDVAALQNAILTANNNNQDDTINLASGGQYLLTAVYNSAAAEDALPIIAHVLTIDGHGATIRRQANANLRIFDVVGNLDLVNLTMENARAGDRGGAIQNGSGTLTVSNCTFSANNSFYEQSSGLPLPTGGAALYNKEGTVTLSGCTLSNNVADNDNNGIAEGGAIFNSGSMTVLNCTFFGNIASSHGGAIFSSNAITVQNCTFYGNSARASFNPNGQSSGGGIFNTGAPARVENCTFARNSAFEGGAITNSASANSAMTVSSCTFSDNPSNNGYVFSHSVAAMSSTITIRNSLLQNNATTDLGVNGGGATIVSQGYNLSDASGGGFLNGPGDQTFTNARLDPAGLQNNGGPTQTIALTANSPAIDRGNRFGLPTDQRGQSRPVDLPAYPNVAFGDGSDIGAFEVSDILQSGSTIFVNSLTDHDDNTCGSSDCSLREAINRANNTDGTPAGGLHTILFDAGITGTIALFSELDVTSPLALTGPGARNLTVSGNNATRVFSFHRASTLTRITIANGHVAASPGQTAQGGGIYSNTGLVLTDCAFTGNQVLGGNGFGFGATGNAGQGGAIFNEGNLAANGCTFASNNMALGGDGAAGLARQRGGDGGAGEGGAVFNAPGVGAFLTNCSFYANIARGGNGASGSSGGNGGAGHGGAVGNAGSLVMTACTVSSNSGGNSTGGTGGSGNGTPGSASGGITNIGGGTATVETTISANNVANGGGGADVDGTFTSGGYNLLGSGDHSTGFTATGDMKGTDAVLLNAGVIGPPSNTGGPTDTFTLTSTSPAIDASSNSVAPHRDQRGYLRTGTPDIGAFEYNGGLLNLISVTRTGGDFVANVEVVQGKVYRLERKLNITDAAWQSIAFKPDFTATGDDIEPFTDFVAFTSFTHAFYHVIFVR